MNNKLKLVLAGASLLQGYYDRLFIDIMRKRIIFMKFIIL